MPLQATSGAASYDAFGGGVAAVPNYIEECFSTTLYTGNGSTQTINNGIDLAGKGGLVWGKNRSAGWDHYLADTAQGVGKFLSSNLTSATQLDSTSVTAFNSNGFSIGNAGSSFNDSGQTYASWTFRKQPKFFDIVTWTGNSTARSIAHNLGSTPGCIIVKVTNLSGENWVVWHRSINQDSKTQLFLNTTDDAVVGGKLLWGASGTNANMTSTTFSVGTATETNETGNTYVAYLFAHNAGGFGLSGTDNVISCGSFTTAGSGIIPTVNLGYEPQWILAKPSSGVGNWFIMDNMRGWYNQQADQGNALFPNTSGAEAASYNAMIPTATGFTGPAVNFGAGVTYIYIAIRRPMKVPTTGTSVFAMAQNVSNSGVATSGFPVDAFITTRRSEGVLRRFIPRLTNRTLVTNTTASESDDSSGYSFDNMTGVQHAGMITSPNFWWMFKRASGFMDVCCYTSGVSDPTTLTLNHNLGAVPQMMIKKARQTNGVSNSWRVYHIGLNGGSNPQNAVIRLDDSGAETVSTPDWGNTSPTATQLTVGYVESGISYVTYLFATCPGVSKVGSYTGTGSTQTINCGFTGGARFILIKPTSTTGNWMVWDTVRGISSSNDPYLALNNTNAEDGGPNWINTDSTGFGLTNANDTLVNSNGVEYIFLAIA